MSNETPAAPSAPSAVEEVLEQLACLKAVASTAMDALNEEDNDAALAKLRNDPDSMHYCWQEGQAGYAKALDLARRLEEALKYQEDTKEYGVMAAKFMALENRAESAESALTQAEGLLREVLGIRYLPITLIERIQTYLDSRKGEK